MASAAEIQALLRFLSQDAKIPLASAMGSVKELQKAELGSPEAIAKVDNQILQVIFKDEKLVKQVINAAKRVSKKRAAPRSDESSPKKAKRFDEEAHTPAQIEAALALPESDKDEECLRQITVYTNRAPLVLAFAVTVIKYTMPSQPQSSRLSLAQAVVSMNSRSKAVSIGLESRKSAEEEGWGEGQPIVRVMGRDVRVLKRWNYDIKDDSKASEEQDAETKASTQNVTAEEEEPALWGLDLEALKKSNATQPQPPSSRTGSSGQLPIYTPQSARDYLLKSFDNPPDSDEGKKKHTKAENAKIREENLASLLAALDISFKSWAKTLDARDIDRRAWSWYLKVRPEVADGVAGWGGKGAVRLADIIDLKR